MTKVQVSVVIPNYNGEPLLKICLKSLRKQSFIDLEIIVIDNGSTDSSIKFLETSYPEIKLVKLAKNYGFSRAVNEGIKVSKGQFIFLLNNDTELDKNCTKYLVENAIKMEVGFVVPKVLDFYQRDRLELAGNCFVIDSVGHLFSTCVSKKDSQKFSIAGETFLIPGCATLIKKSVFQKVGMFDEDYFMYLEDADLSLRAQLAGVRGWFNPAARVYHMGRASAKKTKSFDVMVFRNMTMTILKDFPMGLILHNFNWLKIILVHLNTVRFLISKGYLLEVVKAEFFILVNLGEIFKKRKKIQKSKTVTDEYIIENVLEKKWFKA